MYSIVTQIKLLPKFILLAFKTSDLNVIELLYRIFYLAVVRRFELDEILADDMLKSDIKNSELSNYDSRLAWWGFQKKVNPEPIVGICLDKHQFNAFCNAANLSTPKIYGTLYLSDELLVADKSYTGLDQIRSFFDNKLFGDFFIKSAYGVGGHGMYSLKREGPDLYTDFNGKKFNFVQLIQVLRDTIGQSGIHYTELARQSKFIICETLKPHSSLKELSGANGLMTARVSTLVSKGGEVKIVYCGIKIICGDNFVDNWQHGQTGNFFGHLKPENGQVYTVFAPAADGITVYNVETHPRTNQKLIGYAVPRWQEVLALVKAAAIKFMPIRTIGWDVAITDDGVYLIEANCWWEHDANKIRSYPEMKNAVLSSIK